MHSEYRTLRKLGSFSWDDPEAGRKLIENLDRRRVRLQVVEMCWHFGIPTPDGLDRLRAKAFLDDLCRRGELAEPVSGLYCRPDMIGGSARLGDAAEKLAALYRRVNVVPAAVPPVDPAPKPSLREYKRRIKAERTKIPRPVPAPSPDPAAEAAPPAPPKARTVPTLQKQTEWILRWLRSRGGSAPKSALTEAAVADGLVRQPSDLDVPLQHLFNRTRAYFKDHLLTLTRFGEQEAEYLDLRRGAFEVPAPKL